MLIGIVRQQQEAYPEIHMPAWGSLDVLLGAEVLQGGAMQLEVPRLPAPAGPCLLLRGRMGQLLMLQARACLVDLQHLL